MNHISHYTNTIIKKIVIPHLTEDEKEEFEERAAIIEHDGKLTREQAENEAMRIIIEKRNTQK